MQDSLADSTLLEFKGRMLMVTVLHLHSLDRQQLLARLNEQLEDGHDWLTNMPLVLDINCQQEDTTAHLPGIVDLLRDQQLTLLGLAGSGVNEQLATFLGLPLINLSGGRGRTLEKPREKAATSTPSRLIDQPVRSGQQVYSEGDLIITSSVSDGAELLAEGNIHVYGNLRGRALAGVRGNGQARIFCQQLNAALVSIAGHYRVAEGLPDASLGEAVQISLVGESMQFDPLKH